MIKLLDFSRSPVTAAAGSGVLIVGALVGVIFAAGSAAGPSNAAAQYTAAPLNQAPLVLPKPCVVTRNHQACDAKASKPHRAKQVTKQPAQPTALPVATVAPNPTSP